MTIDWMARAEALRDELVARRRDLHKHPELAFEEVRTAGIVAKELNALGLEVTTGVGKTGVVAVLEGHSDGPTVLVRCDMDALPVLEANTTDYISETPGKMHACGHDGHVSIALAAAKLLSGERDHIAGRVKFIFQPAEEIARGAQAMINDGVLSNPTPDVSFGLHLWTHLPIGEVSLTEGAGWAGANDWEAVIRGAGGHAAMPDVTRDPIVAGAQIVSALQSIVSRNVNPMDTAVVSTTIFQAGEAKNVIPMQARLAGTFRCYVPETRDFVERRLREIIIGVAAAMGCEAEVNVIELTPPLINDPVANRRLRGVFSQPNFTYQAQPLILRDNVRTMAAEDMSILMRSVPGVYLFVGAANAARHLDFPHHHPRFDFDEDVLPIATGLMAAAVADYVIPR